MGINKDEDRKSLDVVQDYKNIIHALGLAVEGKPLPEKDKKVLERLKGNYEQALELETGGQDVKK